ncbi:MAG: ABC transporter permease, partial [Bacteroidales bacterium]|nr:ABC transporter permease [Bacteroidales bacterium]
MIRNYFIIAIRNLWRNRIITVINLTGMAIGFAISLSFWSWTRFDLSFDRFHEDVDQMYILNIRLNMDGSEYTSQRTGGVFASELPENFPQIESQCRVSEALEFELGIVSEGDSTDIPMKYFSEDEVIAVDSTFLSFFSFELIKGDVAQIFSQRGHLVVTETLAERMFGDEDPMGRSIRIGEGDFFKVVGVVKDPPGESTFQFSALLGFHIMEDLGYPVDEAGGTIYYNNFKLAEGTDLEALNVKINEYAQELFDEELDSYFFLDRFTRLHLHGES